MTAPDTVPIVTDEPESNRRLMALLEAHALGVISYVAPRYDPDNGSVRDYPVVFCGQVYYLKPEDVLAKVHAFGAAFGPDVADRLAYEHDLRYADAA